jgi:hypothetical protein
MSGGGQLEAAVAIWRADRQVHQRRVVAALYAAGASVACDRRAVLAGGLRGSGKDAELARAGVSRAGYLTVSIDLVLQELARRSLIPVVAGTSPLEAADLVHAEAQHLAKRLAARAAADCRNLLLDITMASQPSIQNWLVNLAQAGYQIVVITAAINGPDAASWADAEHRRREDDYRLGRGLGGRYVPAESILAAASVAASIAGSDWDAILTALGSQQDVPRFPSGRLLAIARAMRNGQATLADLTDAVRSSGLEPVPPVSPPTLAGMRAAADDLEPWIPGSFDEITLACDLGWITDADYAELVQALTSTRP